MKFSNKSRCQMINVSLHTWLLNSYCNLRWWHLSFGCCRISHCTTKWMIKQLHIQNRETATLIKHKKHVTQRQEPTQCCFVLLFFWSSVIGQLSMLSCPPGKLLKSSSWWLEVVQLGVWLHGQDTSGHLGLHVAWLSANYQSLCTCQDLKITLSDHVTTTWKRWTYSNLRGLTRKSWGRSLWKNLFHVKVNRPNLLWLKSQTLYNYDYIYRYRYRYMLGVHR